MFVNYDRVVDNGLGIYVGTSNGNNDLHSTSSQNLRRGFISTPNSNNLLYPSNLSRPATSSGPQGATILGNMQKPQQVQTLQQMLYTASNVAAGGGGGDSGGADPNNQDLMAAKRSRSTQPGLQ
jgi:hypothetical protein